MQIYEPAEDSFLLAKCIKNLAKTILKNNKEASFLDMGTGSCIQSQTALKCGFKKKNILASDINNNAVQNAKNKGFKAINSNLFRKINERYDLIAFNAPYLPYSRYDSNKDTCGGKKGYETSLKFIRGLKKHLKEGRRALLLISTLTSPDVIEKELKNLDFSFKKAAFEKTFFEEIIVLEIRKT
ncbi:MAG: HemK2/MTQ2 family protein methyltransferase [archaeon]